ncbi:hypothetical protein J7L48_06070, partial [bacterium]|nr:hypothetical protein [bacterium]
DKELKLHDIFKDNIFHFNNKNFELLLSYNDEFLLFLKSLLDKFVPNYNELKTVYLYYQLAIAMGKNIVNIKYEKGISKKNYEIFVNAYKEILNEHIANIEEKAKIYAKKMSKIINTTVKYRLKDGNVEFYFNISNEELPD